MLGIAYFKVTKGVNTLSTADKLLYPILMGIVGTVLVFWSLSGFILKVVQGIKSIYLKGTNMFVLRQLNSKINTNVVSMSVICLMLFITITILSSSLALKNTMQREISEVTPVDINLSKNVNLNETYLTVYGKEVKYTEKQLEDSKISIKETLQNNGFDMELLKDVIEIPMYKTNEWAWHDSFGSYYDVVNKEFSMLLYDTPEIFVKISDYNKIARLYGIEEYTLNDDQFLIICDYPNMIEIRNNGLKYGNNTVTLNGITYNSKYKECKEGFVEISTNHTNTGIIVLPDNAPLKEEMKYKKLLVANYNANTDAKKEEIENICYSDTGIVKKILSNGIDIECNTKISLIESSVGLATIVTFISIYLGIIFLIASAAILALKQLSESSDNKQRYSILRKIGCDERKINNALFLQIGIFFALPLVLAIIHSIFGIQFGIEVMSGLANKKELLPSIISTIIVMGLIYGVYFIATYFGAKSIIKEEE